MDSQALINLILENTTELKANKIQEYDGGISVYLTHPSINWGVWVDCWVSDNDILADWNQYIFYTDNEDDQLKKELQENADIFDIFTSVAIDFLVDLEKLEQDINGDWQWKQKTDEELLEENTTKLYDILRYEYFFDDTLLDIINDILEDIQELTLDEFTRELEWKIKNDYDGGIMWAILKNYTSPLDDTPNKFEKSKTELLNDIKTALKRLGA